MRRRHLRRLVVASGVTTAIASGLLFVAHQANMLLVGALLTTSLVPLVAHLASRETVPDQYPRVGVGLVIVTSVCIGMATALRPEMTDREVINGFSGFIFMFAVFLGISSLLLAIVGVLRDGSGSPADE